MRGTAGAGGFSLEQRVKSEDGREGTIKTLLFGEVEGEARYAYGVRFDGDDGDTLKRHEELEGTVVTLGQIDPPIGKEREVAIARTVTAAQAEEAALNRQLDASYAQGGMAFDEMVGRRFSYALGSAQVVEMLWGDDGLDELRRRRKLSTDEEPAGR